MSFAQQLLLNIPSYLLCLILILIAALFSVGGIILVHRLIPHYKLKRHNDIAGPIFSTLGVIYAVILAFMVVVVWQKFDRISLNTEMEVNCLINLYIDAEPFEQSFKQEVRNSIATYTKEIVKEWSLLSKGESSLEANKLINKIFLLYSRYSPRNKTEEIFFEKSVNKANELFNLRVMRLIDSHTGVHPLLWFVLISGGVITIVFTIFFGSESVHSKILMSTLLAISIVLVLYTILELSFPFTGSANISVKPFEHLVEKFNQLDLMLVK